MKTKNLEQVKKLIDRIADSYSLPTSEQTEEMRKLTGTVWDAEELQMMCCEYWSHHSLEETAYLMFHGEYPPVHEVKLIFWKYKTGVVLDDQTVYEKYRLGRGTSTELEALPLEEILQNIRQVFSGWQQNHVTKGESCRFDCLEQANDWTDTHFRIFVYGRDTDAHREYQIMKFSCHNMSEEQINIITACMDNFQCSLHIREEH